MIDRPIGDVLKAKANQELLVVAATSTVSEAVAAMNARSAGSVLIRGASGRIDGIFTERDLMRRVVGEGREPKSTPVSAVMSANVRHVHPSETVIGVLRLMLEHGYRHILVDDASTVRGLLSIRDLMGWLVLPDEPIAHEGRGGVIRARAEDAIETLQGR
jgi:CBS domain-containing protein